MACCKEHEVHQGCVECDIGQRSRNHYFTGKLMVKRDFADEQLFWVGKERRHNQRLHGEGVVCGLKVKQHANRVCNDRYVVIEPGEAIDCCGREIFVECEEMFEFREAFLEEWKRK